MESNRNLPTLVALTPVAVLVFLFIGIFMLDRVSAQELLNEELTQQLTESKAIGSGIDGLLTPSEYYEKVKTEPITKKDFLIFQEEVMKLLSQCKK